MTPEFPAQSNATVFTYHWADGSPAFAVVRKEATNGHDKKSFNQWSLLDGVWTPKQHIPSGKRPIFGLPDLLDNPSRPILIVEGEKKRLRAATLFPDYFITCWAGGSSAVKHTDWSPLTSRQVTIWPDNDGPGINAAKAIQTFLPHARIVDVPLSFPEAWDLGDDAPEGWTDDKIRALVDVSIPRPLEQPPTSPTELPPLLGIVNHLDWPEETPPTRKWIVDGIIPAATVTLLQGDGGLGKSLLTLQLIYACSTGREWLKQKTHPCKTFAMYCEDEEVELQRRMWGITQYYRENHDGQEASTFADLHDMVLVSRVGMDNLLVEFENAEGGRAKYTTLLHQIEQAASEHGAELIILDSLHDLYGGNENNRVQVRQFINGLQRIALQHGPAIVLNGHPSMSGLSSQTGTSGSTAWSNSVRSRLYLARDRKFEDEKPPYTGPLMLRIMKANYAAVGTHIELEWNYGFFKPKNLPVGSTQSSRDKEAQIDRAFMDCLEEAYRQNRPPQYAQNGQYFAPKIFAQMPCAQGFGPRDFRASMERLINEKKIEIIEPRDGPGRNKTKVIIPTKSAKKSSTASTDKSDWESIEDIYTQ